MAERPIILFPEPQLADRDKRKKMKKISVYNQIGPASVGEEEEKMLFKAMGLQN